MSEEVAIQNFTVKHGEAFVSQPCLNIVLFGTKISPATDLGGPVAVFAKYFGDSLKWYRNDPGAMHLKRLANLNAILDKALNEWRSEKKSMTMLELSSGHQKSEWAAPFFEQYFTSGFSRNYYLRLALPPTWLEECGVDRLENLLRELTSGLDCISSGYIGLGVLWNRSSLIEPELAPLFREWAKRYPGLTASDPLGQIYPAEHGLVDVAWVMLLGPTMCESLGGEKNIASILGVGGAEAPIVKSLHAGLVWIQAGDTPDLNGPSVKMQYKVGAALSGLCNQAENAKVVMSGFPRPDEDGMLAKWANRFFTGG